MVAVMAMRLDRLHYFRLFHLLDWTDRCYVPYQLSRCQQSLFWYMGLIVARLQQSCHGLHMVWCSVMDWWWVSFDRNG